MLVERGRHCEDDRIWHLFDKTCQVPADVLVSGMRVCNRRTRSSIPAQPAASARHNHSRRREGMPAKHEQIERDRIASVELARSAQNIRVQIAVEAAVQKLVPGCKPI